MTKQELAQTIKAKYPQYQNIDDAVLVDKILAKYPEYQTRITEPTKESPLIVRGQQLKKTVQDTASGKINPASAGLQTLGAVAGGVGDLLYAGLKTVLPRATGALEKGIGKVASTDTAQVIAQKYSEWATKNPEISKDLESALNIAALLPVGKAGQLGAKGLEQGVKVTGQAMEVAKPALGTSLRAVGTLGEKTGKAVVSASIPPVEQAGKILAYKAKNPILKRFGQAMEGVEKAPITPADVLIKYNLATLSRSGIGIKAKRLATDLFENKVRPALKEIKESISKDTIFSDIKNKIAQNVDITQRKSLTNALEALADDYKNVRGWSATTLDKIKSSMASRLPSKVWKGQDIAGDMANLRKMFSDSARKQIRSKLPKEIITIYDEYGSLLGLSKIGEKALKSGINTNLIGLTGEAFRMATTPFTTIGGSVISKIGSGLKKLGTKLK